MGFGVEPGPGVRAGDAQVTDDGAGVVELVGQGDQQGVLVGLLEVGEEALLADVSEVFILATGPTHRSAKVTPAVPIDNLGYTRSTEIGLHAVGIIGPEGGIHG